MNKEQKVLPVKEKLKQPKRFRFRWFYLVLVIGLIIINFFYPSSGAKKTITWQEFKTSMLPEHDVLRLEVINNEEVNVFIKPESLKKNKYKDVESDVFNNVNKGPHYSFSIGSIEVFEQQLLDAQINFKESDKIPVSFIKKTDWWTNIFVYLLPLALFIFLWINWSRLSAGGRNPGNYFDFGKSRAHEFEMGKLSKITFNDIAGYDEAKTEIMEVVEFLKHPERFVKLGAKIPKGILLMGPPGSGKTHMAKAVAGEAGVPFFSLSGSEFVEMFVGVGAARVRDLFKKAKEKAPSIVFIDEIDAIGRVRGAAVSLHANDERESTLNQLLAEMDGFDANTNIIVIAATNRADILDTALLRPGRFDRHIFLELPDKAEREAIFKIHIKPLRTEQDKIDIPYLAAQTPGFSGADIANVCNEAALIAARSRKELVEQNDFLDAIDRIIGGLEKKSKIISEGEKEIIAYHEAGHALVSWNLKSTDSLIKVSIIPRGKSLGLSMFLPQERQILTYSQLMDRICLALGGRTAEELVFKEASSGALDDLEKATKEAYTMVAMLGLSHKVGNISYYDSTGTYETFQKPYSEATSRIIDSEVKRLLNEAHEMAKKILSDNRDKLDQLASLLLEKEVLQKEDLESILTRKNNALPNAWKEIKKAEKEIIE